MEISRLRYLVELGLEQCEHTWILRAAYSSDGKHSVDIHACTSCGVTWGLLPCYFDMMCCKDVVVIWESLRCREMGRACFDYQAR